MKHVLGGMSFPELLMRSIHAESTCFSDYSRPRKRAGRYEKGAERKKRFKFLPNGKIVDWFKFKAFAN